MTETTKRSPLRPLLVRALERESPLSPALAELSWSLADSTNDEALMVLLAKREDVPADILEKISEVSAVAVRVQYLSRPDIDPVRRRSILDGEKRGTVLALLAADPDCDHATLMVLAQHKTMKVTTSVIANEKAPVEVRRAAVLHVDQRGWQLSGAGHAAFSAFVRADVAGHDLYARSFNNRAYLRLICGSTSFSEQGLRRLVEVLVDRDAASVTKLAGRSSLYMYDQARKRLGHLVAALAVNMVLPDDVALHLEDLLVSLGGSPCADIEAALACLDGRRRGSLGQELSTARHSRDPVELAELVHPAMNAAVALCVCKNEAASPATTVAASKHLGGQSSLDVVTARVGQPDVLLALWEDSFRPMIYFTPGADQVELIMSMLASTQVPASQRLSLVQRLIGAKRLPEGCAALLPIGAFDQYLTGPVADVGVDVLVAALEEKPVSPDILLTLVSGFDGSITELVQLCDMLDQGDAADAGVLDDAVVFDDDLGPAAAVVGATDLVVLDDGQCVFPGLDAA